MDNHVNYLLPYKFAEKYGNDTPRINELELKRILDIKEPGIIPQLVIWNKLEPIINHQYTFTHLKHPDSGEYFLSVLFSEQSDVDAVRLIYG